MPRRENPHEHHVEKRLFGLLTVIVPILLTVALFYFWSVGNRVLGFDPAEVSGPQLVGRWPRLFRTEKLYLNSTVYCGIIAASLFLWSAAAGVNRRDEVSAGAVSLAVMVGWTALIVLLARKTAILGDTLWLKVVG